MAWEARFALFGLTLKLYCHHTHHFSFRYLTLGQHRVGALRDLKAASVGICPRVMQRIAAPMVGGMVTAPLLSLFVVPAVYLLIRKRQTKPISQPTHPSLHEASQ